MASPQDAPPRYTSGAHWSLYVLVGVLAAHVLVRASGRQIYDTNFYVLWESTALLAGDHPYRDFYLMGWPLLTAMSTAVQWMVGNRLIGEFLIHWSFIVAGVIIGFHLAVRLSGSVAASLATTLLVIAALAATPTFSFPKLFFYPLAVWFGWWYMERPGFRRAAMMGFITAIAFLFRHDHGVYIGVASVLAFVLARLAVPASREWRAAIREIGMYTAVAAIVIAPWAVVVELNEGIVDYVQTRAEWNSTWAPDRSPYLLLRDFNPAPVLAGRAAGGEASENDEPFRSRLPPRETAQHWLVQVTLLLPILVLLSAALDVLERVRRREPIRPETCRSLLAAGLAVVVADHLFREESYFLVTLPLTAAFAAQLLAGRIPGDGGVLSGGVRALARRVWHVVRPVLAVTAFLITSVAVLGFVDELRLLTPIRADELPMHQLLTSPPIDAFQPAAAARQLDRPEWVASDADRKQKIMMRYMHDCTRDGDRILVIGSTPYQVGYYVERPIAGGHLQWHHRWRSDPPHEMQSLALIERQSVPFAFSTHDPVLEDFTAYPRIHEYLSKNYVELEGSDGRLLVDARRKPTGAFGRLAFPCFR